MKLKRPFQSCFCSFESKNKNYFFFLFFKVADGEMALPTFCTWMEAIPHGGFWIICQTVVRFVWVFSIRGLWPRQPSEKSIWPGLMPCPEFVKLHTARRPCFPDRNNGRSPCRSTILGKIWKTPSSQSKNVV